MKLTQTFIALAGTLALATASLQGQTYTEIGDAGQTLAGAQGTGLVNGNPLTSIFGTLSSPTDADLFLIRIMTPTMFSASTVGGSTLDTALFLLNSSGMAIYTNDDASGASVQSTLPAGTAFTMTLAPGTYYLGISLSGNEPINSNGQLLFAAYIGGDSTSVRGAAAGINPNTHSNFNGTPFFNEMGAYRIDLTSALTAVVPEPTTIGLCVMGAAVLGATLRKRRKARSHSA